MTRELLSRFKVKPDNVEDIIPSVVGQWDESGLLAEMGDEEKVPVALMLEAALLSVLDIYDAFPSDVQDINVAVGYIFPVIRKVASMMLDYEINLVEPEIDDGKFSLFSKLDSSMIYKSLVERAKQKK